MYYDFLVKIPENTGKFLKINAEKQLILNILMVENIFQIKNTIFHSERPSVKCPMRIQP